MEWLPMYLDAADLAVLKSDLDEDQEIAWLVGQGTSRWKAVSRIHELSDGDRLLWHVPSGPLPLLPASIGGETEPILDPWAGWTERRPGANRSTPYFGPGHPGVIKLNIQLHPRPNRVDPPGAIGMSGFQWIANYYRSSGKPAAATTQKWWSRLRASVKRQARLIPRGGPIDGPHAEIWAFPSALAAIASGRPRASNS
jgi:hypothetical protein